MPSTKLCFGAVVGSRQNLVFDIPKIELNLTFGSIFGIIKNKLNPENFALQNRGKELTEAKEAEESSLKIKNQTAKEAVISLGPKRSNGG